MKSLSYPKIFAHRGASAYAPENTLAAFAKAKELGASWIELDVQLSADNHLVVFHDDTLQRCSNGQGLLRDQAYSALSQLDAGSWFKPSYHNESICLLQQALDFIVSAKMHVNIEIKAEQNALASLIKTLTQLLEKIPPDCQILISSSSLHCLQAVAKSKIGYPLALIMDDWSESSYQTSLALGCQALHLNAESITAERLAHIKKQKLYVAAYTVNDVEQAQRLYQLGVDALFTDYYDVLAARFP